MLTGARGTAKAHTDLVSGDWEDLDFDSTTDLTDIPDHTAALQGMIDLVGEHGWGGIIELPSGVFRINGAEINSGGVNIVGAGWEQYSPQPGPGSPALRGKRGTYILTDDVTKNAFSLGSDARQCRISDMGFIQPQTADGVAFSPVVFPPTIIGAPDGGTQIFERLLFWGCYQPMQLGSVGHTLGSYVLRDIEYTTFADLAAGGGIHAYGAQALSFDNVAHISGMLGGNTYQQIYADANGSGIVITTVAKASLANLSFTNILNGLVFNGFHSSVPRIRVAGIDCFAVTNGILEAGTDVAALIEGMTFRGYGTSAPSYAIKLTGATAKLIVDQLETSQHYDYAVLANGTSGDVIFGVGCWFDDFGMTTGASAAVEFGAGYTGVLSNNSRFTNAHGGAAAGGAGTITRY